MDPDITREMIEKLIAEQKKRTDFVRNPQSSGEPNRKKQRKAKKLADAMRKRQRGCKQHRTGIKPKRK